MQLNKVNITLQVPAGVTSLFGLQTLQARSQMGQL